MELNELISQVEKIFPYDKIDNLELNENYTNKYYAQSNLGYRFVHSNKGSVHMALSKDNTFREDDYLAQVKIIEERIRNTKKENIRVLELGCGKGFNIEYLASKFENASFVGIDITREHLKQATRRTKTLDNATIRYMSFDDFNFNDQKFDLIYEIESICHSLDQSALLQNIYQLLSNNGKFIAFEGFRNRKQKDLQNTEIKLMNYIEKSMAVAKGIEITTWMNDFREIFGNVVENDISNQIKPNLRRFNNLAGKYFRRPKLAKYINLFVPKKLVMNSIAGYLMLYSVENKYHVYYHIEGSKI